MSDSCVGFEPSFCRRVVNEREADRLVRSVSLLSAISAGHDTAASPSSSVLHSRQRPKRAPLDNTAITTTDGSANMSTSGLLQLTHAPSVQASGSSFRRNSTPSAGGDGSANILLDWRTRLPFVVPVQHPELMSYDPTMCHSVVRRLVRDNGLRAVCMPAVDVMSHSDTLDLNVERGVLGMSLRKHSEAFRMTRVDTFPGFVPSSRQYCH
jgi:hypothetical protein